jgi:hypothetical protein
MQHVALAIGTGWDGKAPIGCGGEKGLLRPIAGWDGQATETVPVRGREIMGGFGGRTQHNLRRKPATKNKRQVVVTGQGPDRP